MSKIGIWELLVILLIVVVIFGPKALPQLAKSIKGFKKELNADDDEDVKPAKTKKSEDEED